MKKIVLSMVALLMALSVSAADLYVNPVTGSDANDGTTEATALQTIETAVLSKLQNDVQTTIHIADNSVITLTAILNFDTDKKVLLTGNNVTLKADDHPGKLYLADEDDNDTGSGSKIISAGANCVLKIKGITFQNGRQVEYLPGGAILFEGILLEIDSCKFIDNQAGSAGGAIAARANSVVVKNSYFEGNNILGGGARGAAIMQCGPADGDPGTLIVQNCTFNKNMTQWDGYGFVINIYDGTSAQNGGGYSNVSQVQVNNCTFTENWSNTANQSVIDLADGDCDLILVNNTFYKNDDCALRFDWNKVYMANNIIIAGKLGIMSYVATDSGRDEITAVNNIVVGSEDPINNFITDACFNADKNANNNIVVTAANYPLSNVGLAVSLSTDNFVPYLAITSASSTLIDAGTDNTSEAFEANYVLPYDILGHLTNNKKDIGAFEYNGVTGIFSAKQVSDDYNISQSGSVIEIQSNTEKSFTLNVVDMSGKVVYMTKASNSVSIDKNSFKQGVHILMFDNGNTISTKKVLF